MSDFVRETDRQTGQIKVIPAMLLDQHFSKNCYECHKSPVLPIHPKAQYEFDPSGMLAETSDSNAELFNERIKTYGRCDLVHMHADSFGPCIGASTTEDFVRSASPGQLLSDDSLQRIKDAMNCARCHEGTANLNYPMTVKGNLGEVSFEEKKDLAQTYIQQGWMPPNSDLTVAERSALWNALQKQYLNTAGPTGLLVDWLRGH